MNMELNEGSQDSVPMLSDTHIQFMVDPPFNIPRSKINNDIQGTVPSQIPSITSPSVSLTPPVVVILDSPRVTDPTSHDQKEIEALPTKKSLRKVIGQVLSKSPSSLSVNSESNGVNAGHQLMNKMTGYFSPFQSRNSSSVSLNNQQNNEEKLPVPSVMINNNMSNSSLNLSPTRRHTTVVVPVGGNKFSVPVDEKDNLRSYTPEKVKETRHVYVDYDPVTKRKVLNSYEILGNLGKGQHGKVKLARDMLSQRLVAIKIVDRRSKPRLGKLTKPGSSQEDKIRREIAIMKKCDHPHVVKLIEVLDDETSRKIYMVLEYLEKGEIKWQVMDEATHETLPVLSYQDAQKVFRDVVSGLEYLHYQGIIHRDIKPANLLVSADNIVKISDFGVSFAASLDYADNELELCKTAGTPAFLAPELCETDVLSQDKEMKIDHKIDIWALGVTLFCLLFGRLPFNSDSEFKLFEVINNEELQIPDKSILVHSEDVTQYEWDIMVDILKLLLSKNPKDRIDIPEIKLHDFFLHGLSKADLQKYLTLNDSVKLDLSNDDLNRDAVGIGSKIKKTLVKALKRGFSTPEEYRSQSTENLDSTLNSSSSSSKQSTLKLNDSLNRSLILSELLSPEFPSSVGTGTNSPLHIPSALAGIKNLLGERRGSADLIETKDFLEGSFRKSNNAALDHITKLNDDHHYRGPVGVNTFLNENKSRKNSVDQSSMYSLAKINNKSRKDSVDQSSVYSLAKFKNKLRQNASFASLDSYRDENNVIDFSGFVPVDYTGTGSSRGAYRASNCDDNNNDPKLYQPMVTSSSFEQRRKNSTCSSSSVTSSDLSSSESEENVPDNITSTNTLKNAGRSPFTKNRLFSLQDDDESENNCSSNTDDEDDDGKELMFAFGPPRDDPYFLKSRVMSHESNISGMMRPASTNSIPKVYNDSEYVIPLSSSTVDLPEEFQNFIPEFKSPPASPVTNATNNLGVTPVGYVPSPLGQNKSSEPSSIQTTDNKKEEPSPLSTATILTSPQSSIKSRLLRNDSSLADLELFKNHYNKANNVISFEKAHHLGPLKIKDDVKQKKRYRNNSVTIGLLQSGHESERKTETKMS